MYIISEQLGKSLSLRWMNEWQIISGHSGAAINIKAVVSTKAGMASTESF